MHSYCLAFASALLTLVAAQASLPTCANECFIQAIGNTSCSLTDYFCQCTTGNTEIQAVAVPCLCHSTCTTTDLIAVVQDTNRACSSALAASSMTYSAATIGLGACASASAAPTTTGKVASASATSTGAASGAAAQDGSSTSGGSSGSTSTSSASVETSTSSSGASNIAMMGEAMLGCLGLAAFAL